MVGKMRGGPAKAAILGSGMTGLISGSSIANTVTTGTFTIPIMKKTGFSKEKAGAIEVSSSVNGQLMPPLLELLILRLLSMRFYQQLFLMLLCFIFLILKL